MIQPLVAGQGPECIRDLKWLSSNWLLEKKKAKKGETPLGNWEVNGKRSNTGKAGVCKTKTKRNKNRRTYKPRQKKIIKETDFAAAIEEVSNELRIS